MGTGMEIREEKSTRRHSVAYREGGCHKQLEATRFKKLEGTNLKSFVLRDLRINGFFTMGN
jgi:hypothetical protein